MSATLSWLGVLLVLLAGSVLATPVLAQAAAPVGAAIDEVAHSPAVVGSVPLTASDEAQPAASAEQQAPEVPQLSADNTAAIEAQPSLATGAPALALNDKPQQAAKTSDSGSAKKPVLVSPSAPAAADVSGDKTPVADAAANTPIVKNLEVKSTDVNSAEVNSPDVNSPEVNSPGVKSPEVNNPPVNSPAVDESLAQDDAAERSDDTDVLLVDALPLGAKTILDSVVLPNSYVRLTWNSDAAVGGFSEATPVLVVNGAAPGNTLCLVGAVHGDELNGIEMIRQVIFDIDPSKLSGTIIGVPVANIMGFRRNSRYLPDRRDWNRYFPGNTYGSSASRLAHSFFTRVIAHCDSLVDLHTGSFHRTNFPQLRADLSDESVAALAQNFGDIAVLNGRGNANSLRAAAVRAGIPAVTLEAGEPMTMQRDIVTAGVRAIKTLLAKTGMYGKPPTRWNRIAPVYYRSMWVRANQSGILFSRTTLGKRVKEGELLGTVTDPVTNARTRIVSPFDGRVLGMALDQVVLPGFAAYHIGIQTPESILIEESQQAEQGLGELDDEDGDDAGIAPTETIREQPANQ